MRPHGLFTLLTIAVIGAACGDSSATGPAQRAGGTFDANVSGAVSMNLSGHAVVQGTHAFNVTMFRLDQAKPELISLGTMHFMNGMLTPGVHQLADFSDGQHKTQPIAMFVKVGATAAGQPVLTERFHARSGTLTISKADGPHITGTLKFDGIEVIQDASGYRTGTRTISVTSEFSTRPCEEVPDCVKMQGG